MQTGSVKGMAYFYVGNEKVYFWERIRRIQILYNPKNDSQENNVKGNVEIKSKNIVFPFIDVYPRICYSLLPQNKQFK